MQLKLYLILLFVLNIVLSCTYASNDRIMIGGKEYSVRCKAESNTKIMYYAENADKELGTVLYVRIENDSVKSIKIGCNPIYDTMGRKRINKETVPINNTEQLFFIDVVFEQLSSNHIFKSCEVQIFPGCLGDASYELMEKRNIMNTYREALQSLSFYKELTIILKKHKFKVTDIYICDVYPEDSDIIEKFCIVSDSNKNKVYAADADIRVYVEHE